MLSEIKKRVGGTDYPLGGILFTFANCRSRMQLIIEEAPNASLAVNLPEMPSINISKELSFLERAVVKSVVDRIKILTGYKYISILGKNEIILYGDTAIRITATPTVHHRPNYVGNGMIAGFARDTSPFLFLERLDKLPDYNGSIKPTLYTYEKLFSIINSANPQVRMLGSFKSFRAETVSRIERELTASLMQPAHIYFLPEGVFVSDLFTTFKLDV